MRQPFFISIFLVGFALLFYNTAKAQPMLAMHANTVSRPAVSEITEASATVDYTGQKKLLTYLKQLKVDDDQQEYRSGKKFYYHLAGVFARLHLYPLAMKCFLKSVKDSTGIAQGYLDPTNFDDRAVNSQQGTSAKSKLVTYQRITDVFNDGKTAVGYAMLFHVKQPVTGKRRIFVFNNTGHTFITLIKYNADSSYTSASFGFYPQKDHLLSATPLAPVTSSVFKDDAGHAWDEVLGKMITRRKFERILRLTKEFSTTEYDLNNNNCTDFGLQAAALAGINIMDTKGHWPLGSGNNPALTGQAMLEGKVDAGTGDLAQVLTLIP